jgi:hypothetical protein
MKHYATNMAYVTPSAEDESPKTFKRCLYNTLPAMAVAKRGVWEIRVIQIRSTINWTRIWHNLNTDWISEQMKATWYLVIHEIIHTNERLATIRLTDTHCCRQCTECNEGAVIWNWRRARIAAMLRMDP